MRCLALSACLLATALAAQTPPETAEPDIADLLAALARSAATFARSAPGLSARESLAQRGRRGSVLYAKGRRDESRIQAITLPSEFQVHEVVSNYELGQSAGSTGLHEIRTPLTVDKAPAKEPDATRHALTIGLRSPEDETTKMLLEDFEGGKLIGAATDFGPLLLLFTQDRQSHYVFSDKGRRLIAETPSFQLTYRQTSGDEGLTEFRDRGESHHNAEGRIWLRQSDLLPVRITLESEEVLSPKFIVRNEGEVNYCPTRFGLAPATVTHRQFLNQDLLMENNFSYSDYKGRVFLP